MAKLLSPQGTVVAVDDSAVKNLLRFGYKRPSQTAPQTVQPKQAPAKRGRQKKSTE